MTADPTRLRFGPYKPPRLRNDRTFCLYLDCDAVVTRWTDAPVPWPRCRPAHSWRGVRGLLVTGELKRAIQSEAPKALKRWFGVSSSLVWHWRRVFGISGLAPPAAGRCGRRRTPSSTTPSGTSRSLQRSAGS